MRGFVKFVTVDCTVEKALAHSTESKDFPQSRHFQGSVELLAEKITSLVTTRAGAQPKRSLATHAV